MCEIDVDALDCLGNEELVDVVAARDVPFGGSVAALGASRAPAVAERADLFSEDIWILFDCLMSGFCCVDIVLGMVRG